MRRRGEGTEDTTRKKFERKQCQQHTQTREKNTLITHLQRILLGKQTDRLGENRDTFHVSIRILGHDTGTHFNVVVDAQHTLEDTTTGNTTAQIVD
jgi:hypothetical protein